MNANNPTSDNKRKILQLSSWILAILAPICIKIVLGRIVNEGFALYLQLQEGITDIVVLNRRFGESGLGIIAICIGNLTTLVILQKMLQKDIESNHGGAWFGLHKSAPLKLLIYAFSAMIFALGTNYAVNIILKNYISGYESTEKILFSGLLVFRIIVLGIVVPICEELLFRGIVFERLTTKVNTISAIVISALLFGAYHFNLVQFVYASIMGILLGIVYVKEKNLLIPIICHGCANAFIIIWEYMVL